MEEICGLSPHPFHIPHYVTPRDGLPELCDVSRQVAAERGTGWAGTSKRKPPRSTSQRKKGLKRPRKKAS